MIGPEGLFYRYNFTVEESTPLDIEVAVDPEMLGKVFEELVTGRRESGSYYTPRPIVSFMCRESLKRFLSGKSSATPTSITKLIDDHSVEELNENHANEIITALDGLKAVDPACGSGAYLLGLLHELVAIYRLLYSERLVRNPRSLYDLKLRIISQNIYGVDIDPFATNIAMLRLWLSLAVEADEPVPLPNLDFKIETGDSLLGPCVGLSIGLDLYKSLSDRADRLVDLKNDYMNSHSEQKKDLRECILREEKEIGSELRSYSTTGIINWRIQFADVMGAHSGFDIVLANPPYVDSEQMVRTALDYRKSLASSFEVTKGNWDLYIPFWQRCFDLLHPEGHAVLITPNKWLSIAYGKALRGYLSGKIILIADYTHFRAFKKVGVSSIVTMVAKSGAPTISVHRYADGHKLLGTVNVSNEFLFRECPDWGILLSEHIELVMHCIRSGRKIGTICDTEEASTVKEAYELVNYIRESEFPDSTSFRLINTGTIDPFISLWGKTTTVYLKHKYRFPIVSRSDFQTAFPRRFKQMASPKIIISGMRHFEAFLDPIGDWIAGKSTVVLRDFRNGVRPLVILAFLNSSIATFFLKECYGSLGMDGGINFTPSNVKEIPVPNLTSSQIDSLEGLAKEVLVAKTLLVDSDVSSQLASIDHIIFQSLALSHDDIERVLARIGRKARRGRKQF